MITFRKSVKEMTFEMLFFKQSRRSVKNWENNYCPDLHLSITAIISIIESLNSHMAAVEGAMLSVRFPTTRSTVFRRRTRQICLSARNQNWAKMIDDHF